MEKKKPVLSGELILVLAVFINSMGVDLMLHSGSGISAISSVPYAFSLAFPFLTLGTWTYLFQGTLVLSLMVMQKKFVPSYLFSFVVGFVFGELLDLHAIWIAWIPTTIAWRVFCFVASYLLICVGIAISNRCGLPIIPTDLFPRELAEIIKKPYSKVKMTFDLTCLLVTAILTGILLGHIRGLGVGTVIAALTMGKTIGWIGARLDERVKIRRTFYKPQKD